MCAEKREISKNIIRPKSLFYQRFARAKIAYFKFFPKSR